MKTVLEISADARDKRAALKSPALPFYGPD
jgi:hypothetical protein